MVFFYDVAHIIYNEGKESLSFYNFDYFLRFLNENLSEFLKKFIHDILCLG